MTILDWVRDGVSMRDSPYDNLLYLRRGLRASESMLSKVQPGMKSQYTEELGLGIYTTSVYRILITFNIDRRRTIL